MAARAKRPASDARLLGSPIKWRGTRLGPLRPPLHSPRPAPVRELWVAIHRVYVQTDQTGSGFVSAPLRPKSHNLIDIKHSDLAVSRRLLLPPNPGRRESVAGSAHARGGKASEKLWPQGSIAGENRHPAPQRGLTLTTHARHRTRETRRDPRYRWPPSGHTVKPHSNGCATPWYRQHPPGHPPETGRRTTNGPRTSPPAAPGKALLTRRHSS